MMQGLQNTGENFEADAAIEGFYCRSDRPFAPGDHLRFQLSTPGSLTDFPQLVLTARVVRVECNGIERGFRITLQLENTEAITSRLDKG
jgi:hypothetical protein